MIFQKFVTKLSLCVLFCLCFTACTEEAATDGDSTDTSSAPDTRSGVGPTAGEDTTDGSDGADGTDGEPLPVSVLFGIDPIQPISSAPFPNDLYRTGGGITVSRLPDDPVLFDIAAADVVAQWSDIMNTREGFGSTSPIFFFASGPIDESSLEGRVKMVSLAGEDAGREVKVQAWFDERCLGTVVGVHTLDCAI